MIVNVGPPSGALRALTSIKRGYADMPLSRSRLPYACELDDHGPLFRSIGDELN
jgi:hypothetical protein